MNTRDFKIQSTVDRADYPSACARSGARSRRAIRDEFVSHLPIACTLKIKRTAGRSGVPLSIPEDAEMRKGTRIF
jgi:hypothetical protein